MVKIKYGLYVHQKISLTNKMKPARLSLKLNADLLTAFQETKQRYFKYEKKEDSHSI